MAIVNLQFKRMRKNVFTPKYGCLPHFFGAVSATKKGGYGSVFVKPYGVYQAIKLGE